VELIKEGVPFSQALEKPSRGEALLKDPVLEEIRKLRREIENLRKESQVLRNIVQAYLSKIEKLKDLPPSKCSLRERIRAWFIRQGKKQE